MQQRITDETRNAPKKISLITQVMRIQETLSGSGDLGQVLVDAIKNTIWT